MTEELTHAAIARRRWLARMALAFTAVLTSTAVIVAATMPIAGPITLL